jgi:hypothetical protein
MSANPVWAASNIRFVHAVPGAGSAQVEVSGDGQSGTIPDTSFGNSSTALEVDSGSVTFALKSDGKELASLDEDVDDDASYTLVAIAKADGEGAELKLFEDGEPKEGKALVRAIQVTPELGEPDVMVGKRTIAEKVPYGEATKYQSVPPGSYEVSVTRPGGEGDPIATKGGVPLTAGSATTAIIVGSRGEPAQLVTLVDGNAAPSGAPETGFGGLAGGEGGEPSRWLVGLLAALAGAMMGATGLALGGRR